MNESRSLGRHHQDDEMVFAVRWAGLHSSEDGGVGFWGLGTSSEPVASPQKRGCSRADGVEVASCGSSSQGRRDWIACRENYVWTARISPPPPTRIWPKSAFVEPEPGARALLRSRVLELICVCAAYCVCG